MNDTLRLRLDRLERENRRFKLLALAWLAWTACSVAQSDAKVVEAERFLLKGADGVQYGSFELDPKGNPMLLLQKGQERAVLTLSGADGTGLLVRGEDGVVRVYNGANGQLLKTLMPPDAGPETPKN